MKSFSLLVHQPPRQRQDVCLAHGAFTACCYLGEQWTKCPSCIAQAEQAARTHHERQTREAQLLAWQKSLGEAAIPRRFQQCTLKSFRADTDWQKTVLAFAESYTNDFETVLQVGRCALFLGQSGTGKTHLACGIGIRLMCQARRTVLFTSAYRAVCRLKESWHKASHERESDIIARMVFPDLLILDEIGVQFGTETEKLLLFEVINQRYENLKPMILISNEPLEDYTKQGQRYPGVRSFLGQRTYDRLRQNGGVNLIFEGKSQRGQQP
ncbi:ATP-binding protein [Neisseriaceae bacterium TC5R-5]|nr:ATP-binding protein [Neisseriaceae bacterium TC5R-5]